MVRKWCREMPWSAHGTVIFLFPVFPARLPCWSLSAGVMSRCMSMQILQISRDGKGLSRARVCLQTWIFWKWTHLSKMKHSWCCHRRSLCRIISSRQWHTFVPSDYWGLVHGAWTVHGAHSGHAGLQSHRNPHKDVTPEDLQGLKGSRNVNKHGQLFMQQNAIHNCTLLIPHDIPRDSILFTIQAQQIATRCPFALMRKQSQTFQDEGVPVEETNTSFHW